MKQAAGKHYSQRREITHQDCSKLPVETNDGGSIYRWLQAAIIHR